MFFLIMELFSHGFRPVSLSLRLFGNMMGDHEVIGAFIGLTKLVVPVAFYAMGTLVSVIQAFVLCAQHDLRRPGGQMDMMRDMGTNH